MESLKYYVNLYPTILYSNIYIIHSTIRSLHSNIQMEIIQLHQASRAKFNQYCVPMKLPDLPLSCRGTPPDVARVLGSSETNRFHEVLHQYCTERVLRRFCWKLCKSDKVFIQSAGCNNSFVMIIHYNNTCQ